MTVIHGGSTEAAVVIDALRAYARDHIGPVVFICESVARELEENSGDDEKELDNVFLDGVRAGWDTARTAIEDLLAENAVVWGDTVGSNLVEVDKLRALFTEDRP